MECVSKLTDIKNIGTSFLGHRNAFIILRFVAKERSSYKYVVYRFDIY